jgi:TENA/THI-4/PQQC family
MNAAQLCVQVATQLRTVEERIRSHPWLGELEAARISIEGLRAFAGEQLQIIPSDLRSFMMLADRFTQEPAQPYLQGMVAGERAGLQALEGFATAVGLDDTVRRAYEPIAGCQAYPSYVTRLARDGTPAEVAGAFLVNLQAWGGNCARMQKALQSAYGYTEAACAFFALFATGSAELERQSLEVIDAGLAQGVEPVSIARAARLLQAYELLYWDSLPR